MKIVYGFLFAIVAFGLLLFGGLFTMKVVKDMMGYSEVHPLFAMFWWIISLLGAIILFVMFEEEEDVNKKR